MSDWISLLQESLMPTDKVPAGWKTTHQIAKETKRPYATVQGKIRRLLKQGKVERHMFRIQLGRYVRPTPHYKVK